jgi:hypothetical protein
MGIVMHTYATDYDGLIPGAFAKKTEAFTERAASNQRVDGEAPEALGIAFDQGYFKGYEILYCPGRNTADTLREDISNPLWQSGLTTGNLDVS